MNSIDKADFAKALKEFMYDKRLTQVEFGKPMGWDNSRVSKYLKGRLGAPRLGTLEQLIKIYPDFKDYIGNTITEAAPVEVDIMKVHVVPQRAYAGYAQGHIDPDYVNDLPTTYVSKEYEKGNYLVFEIKGESMDDGTSQSICEGDRVLCKELPQTFWTNKLHHERYIFIIVNHEGVLCKKIAAHNPDDGTIILESFNPIFEPVVMNLKDVSQLFYIKKIVERNVRL